jgi:hypothetical protein
MHDVVAPQLGLIDAGELVVEGMAQIVTASSMWIVTDTTYRRLPRTEGTRHPTLSLDGRLDDLTEHRHRGGRWWWDPAVRAHRLQLYPVGEPADGHGILTGVICSIGGAGAPAAPDERAVPSLEHAARRVVTLRCSGRGPGGT